MDELEGHPEGWNSRGDGDAPGDVAATDYTPKPCGEVDSGNNPITNPPCPNCGSTARRTGPGSGPHHQRIECAACGRWLRWLPRPREGANE
jgi:hypothetical protein